MSSIISQMSCSASMRMMRAFFRCSAWASSDIVSCSSSGITMSRTFTEMMSTPQPAAMEKRASARCTPSASAPFASLSTRSSAQPQRASTASRSG